jgi:hypothetical protein
MNLNKVLAVAVGLLLLGTTSSTATPVSHADHWQRVSVPVTKGDITAVAALGERDAWAVGYRLNSDTDLVPVALHWDGTSWTQRSTLPDRSFPQVLAVRSATDIWAAGQGTAHWDGTTWTSRQLARDPAGMVVPNGLTTTADGKTWAVGQAMLDTIKTGVPAVQTWDGTAWTRQALPDVGKGELSSVTAVSATDVWAAGVAYATDANSPETSLVLHWDGSTWQRVTTPNRNGGHTWIGGVTALSTNDVWAVGGGLVGGTDCPFAMHWDGGSWTVTPTPEVADGRLHGVSRSGDGRLWAFGGKGAVSVLLRWNGGARKWEQVPDAGITARGFTAVPGGNTLWTVGISEQGDLVPVASRSDSAK